MTLEHWRFGGTGTVIPMKEEMRHMGELKLNENYFIFI